MENLYKELRSFFANDIDVNDLFDSEAIIWIDWREDDEDVVNYFNDMMDEPIDIKTVSNGKAYGDDILLQKGDKELQIPYGDEQDRDVTIKYFNDFVQPDYEVRWFAESLGNDTLGFTVLSARNIAKQIGCSTQPIYWCYKNMDDLKAEICKKALPFLQSVVLSYSKTGNTLLDLGLGYVRMAYTEPALFKAFYMDNVTNVKLTDIFPESERVVEIMKNSEECKNLSDEELKNDIAKGWMLAHGIASLVAVGMLVYDEDKILEILK